jgi:hypothetical protein
LEPAGSIQLGVVDGPLDTRAPVTVLDKKASVGTSFDTTMGTWTLRFSCNDLAQPGALPSGCARTEYWINGSAHLEATAPVVLSAVGTYRVSYRSLDLMGNAEDETIEFLRIVPATDQDGDGVLDQEDNCMLAPNANLRDTDGDGFGNRCDPDFNQNVTVDSNDASLLKSKLGTPAALSPNLDLDGNGLIDLADMSILQSMFRKPPGPSGLGLFP